MTRRALIALISLGLSNGAHAHELSTTSGTVILRDDHLRLALQVDVIRWLGRLDAGAHRSFEHLAMADHGAATALITKAKKVLVNELILKADGIRLPLARIRFPAPSLIFEVAKNLIQSKASNPKTRGPFLKVIIESKLKRSPKTLDVRLPSSLGEALIEVVKPQSQVIHEGGEGHYQLAPTPPMQPLDKPTAHHHRPKEKHRGQSW